MSPLLLRVLFLAKSLCSSFSPACTQNARTPWPSSVPELSRTVWLPAGRSNCSKKNVQNRLPERIVSSAETATKPPVVPVVSLV